MKSQVLHTVWCNIFNETAGEIWSWSLLGVKGLNDFSTSCHIRISEEHANSLLLSALSPLSPGHFVLLPTFCYSKGIKINRKWSFEVAPLRDDLNRGEYYGEYFTRIAGVGVASRRTLVKRIGAPLTGPLTKPIRTPLSRYGFTADSLSKARTAD